MTHRARIVPVLLVAVVTITAAAAFYFAHSRAAAEKSETYTIAVTQIATHPGIDAVRTGFLDELTARGFAAHKNVRYEFSNANGDFATAQAIARKIAGDKPDLVFAISTPSSQTVLQSTEGTAIPIVFGAVTDPVSAGLVTALDKPGSRITGTTDVWPIREQLQLLQTIVPNAKTVGLLSNPSEANSQHSVRVATEAAAGLGLSLVKVPVTSSAEVPAAARSLIGRVDAIYIPADNTVISAIAAVVAVAEKNAIPLLPGDTSNVEVGGFGTLGHSYYDVGRKSGEIAARILSGQSPASIPVANSDKYEYYFNLKSAKAQGVRIPDKLLRKAVKVYK